MVRALVCLPVHAMLRRTLIVPGQLFTVALVFCVLCAGLALHADYMANMSALGSRMGELHHSPSLIGSTELPFSIDGNAPFRICFVQ